MKPVKKPKKIVLVRKKHGLSQGDIAFLCGHSTALIGMIECGKANQNEGIRRIIEVLSKKKEGEFSFLLKKLCKIKDWETALFLVYGEERKKEWIEHLK